MQNKRKIKGKVTFEGRTSFIGFFMLFFGVYFAFMLGEHTLLLVLFLLIALFGFMLFISIKGVLIDLENKRVKPYLHCLFFKLGKWKSLKEAKIVLEYINQAQTLGNRGTQTTLRTELFAVSFKYPSGKKIIIKEFLNYEKAKKFLDKYSELLQIEKKDCYKRMLEEIAKLRETL